MLGEFQNSTQAHFVWLLLTVTIIGSLHNATCPGGIIGKTKLPRGKPLQRYLGYIYSLYYLYTEALYSFQHLVATAIAAKTLQSTLLEFCDPIIL